jgi:hypothetical protein
MLTMETEVVVVVHVVVVVVVVELIHCCSLQHKVTLTTAIDLVQLLRKDEAIDEEASGGLLSLTGIVGVDHAGNQEVHGGKVLISSL